VILVIILIFLQSSEAYRNLYNLTNDLNVTVANKQFCYKISEDVMKTLLSQVEKLSGRPCLVHNTICNTHYDELLRNVEPEYCGSTYCFAQIQSLYRECVANFGLTIGIENLRPLQAQVIHHMLRNHDVFALLPTSYGKTLAMLVSSIIKSSVNHLLSFFDFCHSLIVKKTALVIIILSYCGRCGINQLSRFG